MSYPFQSIFILIRYVWRLDGTNSQGINLQWWTVQFFRLNLERSFLITPVILNRQVPLSETIPFYLPIILIFYIVGKFGSFELWYFVVEILSNLQLFDVENII